MEQPMALHRIKKGLDLPITGEPAQTIEEGKTPATVALLAEDYIGMKPTLRVAVGDSVKRGQILFEDKKMPGVFFTAPGAGEVVAINRGERRAFQSIVIRLSTAEQSGRVPDEELQSFKSYTGKPVRELTSEQVAELLIESGLWTALRARPFSRVANPATRPHSIFVTVMDTNPLAASVDVALKGNEVAFEQGLLAVSHLTDGKVFVCKAPESQVTVPAVEKFQIEEFTGVHPAGTVGLHIHLLDPVGREKTVWHLNYQDVVAIGKLFQTGTLDTERVIALGGPSVLRPRLLRTRLGVSLQDLLQDEVTEGDNRVISGSVFSGRTAQGDVLGYLGRYHLQVSVLPEGRKREFLGWMAPGTNRFSTISAYLSSFLPKRKFSFDTSTNGSRRAMVPIGMYERVMPMDIEPTFLLRSLIVGDVERAEQLGCLELDEEDLALCTFVCPGKYEYGPILRENLTEIEKEG